MSLAVVVPALAGTGDRLLAAIRTSTKAADPLAQIGEGAVAVLLVAADADGAAAYAARLRGSLPVTALVGVATAGFGDTPEALLARAWPAA